MSRSLNPSARAAAVSEVMLATQQAQRRQSTIMFLSESFPVKYSFNVRDSVIADDDATLG